MKPGVALDFLWHLCTCMQVYHVCFFEAFFLSFAFSEGDCASFNNQVFKSCRFRRLRCQPWCQVFPLGSSGVCIRVYRSVLSYLVLAKLKNQHLLSSRSFSLYFHDNFCVSLSLFVCLCLSSSEAVVQVLARSNQELQVEAMEVPTMHRWSIVNPSLI